MPSLSYPSFSFGYISDTTSLPMKTTPGALFTYLDLDQHLNSAMSQALAANESPHTLRVDFAWSKLSYRIFDAQTDKPLVNVKHNCFKPHMEFIEADSKSTIGTSSIHNFSIHADCTIGDRPLRLKAQKRFSTKYSYLSHAYSNNDVPVVMTWTTTSSLSKWDFILLDEKQEAVARYSTNVWALKKIGLIEFVGPKADSQAVRDEVMITVCTIYYCMTGMLLEKFACGGFAY